LLVLGLYTLKSIYTLLVLKVWHINNTKIYLTPKARRVKWTKYNSKSVSEKGTASMV
jgi:hypothetical protein